MRQNTAGANTTVEARSSRQPFVGFTMQSSLVQLIGSGVVEAQNNIRPQLNDVMTLEEVIRSVHEFLADQDNGEEQSRRDPEATQRN